MIWFLDSVSRCTTVINLLTTDLAWCLKFGPHEEEQTADSGSDSTRSLLGSDLSEVRGVAVRKRHEQRYWSVVKKLIYTRNSGFFSEIIFLEILRSSLLKNYIEFISRALFFLFRETRVGQGVIDRKIMSSFTVLHYWKRYHKNILKSYEVWKYETPLVHTNRPAHLLLALMHFSASCTWFVTRAFFCILLSDVTWGCDQIQAVVLSLNWFLRFLHKTKGNIGACCLDSEKNISKSPVAHI